MKTVAEILQRFFCGEWYWAQFDQS